MSLKEKFSGLFKLPFVTRLVDQIKNVNKNQISVSLSCMVIAATLVTGISINSSLDNESVSSVSKMSAASFVSNSRDDSLTRFIYDNSNILDAVNGGTVTHRSANGETAEELVASRPVQIKLSENSVVFTDLKKKVELKAEVAKKDYEAKFIWSSSDSKIAAVDENGVVKPKMNGTVEILCTEENSGATAECEVTVDTVLAESLKISKQSVTLALNKTVTLKASVGSDDAANKTVKWSSSDKTVATVDSKGKVTPVSAGNAVITCSTTDGSDIKKQCKVTVKNVTQVESIDLNYVDIQFVGLGCTEQLQVMQITPSKATDQSVIWSSSDESVAIVDEYGNVYPQGNGTCDIIATAADGSKVKSSCPVTVSGVVDYVEVPITYEVVIPSNVDVYATANSVVEEADKYVGWLPYVWGGTDLTQGVDCSGFICAVYQKFGYNLWGIRTDLILAGREVSLEEARAGDIIVYKGHVAIYDGNGGKIHAPTEGYMVTHDYGLGNYISIRRVIE